MKKNLPVIKNDERNHLLQAIGRRRKTLTTVVEKYEKLERVIEKIQSEYTTRIGHLYHKDTLLDIELIKHKKITELMDIGLSYDEAVSEIKESMKRQHRIEEELFETLNDFIDVPKENNEPIIKREDVRKLWKKLVVAFHPDLSKNKDDRKKREDIMKKINNAYAANDFQALRDIDAQKVGENIDNYSVAKLQKVIVDLENAIEQQKMRYAGLLKSEWYRWIKKSKKEKEKLFYETEKKILQDLTRKQILLEQLKEKYHIKTGSPE